MGRIGPVVLLGFEAPFCHAFLFDFLVDISSNAAVTVSIDMNFAARGAKCSVSFQVEDMSSTDISVGNMYVVWSPYGLHLVMVGVPCSIICYYTKNFERCMLNLKILTQITDLESTREYKESNCGLGADVHFDIGHQYTFHCVVSP